MGMRINIDVGQRIILDKGDGSDPIGIVGTGNLESIPAWYPPSGIAQVQMAGALRSVRGLELSNLWVITGPVGDFINLPNLETLDLEGAGTSGDFGQLASLLVLQEFNAEDTGITYLTTTLPVWNEVVLNFENCGWVEAMVDALLGDLDTSGAIDGEVNLLGCAAPGTAGAASVVSLVAKGWTVDTE